jgi:hypothetical protein
MHQNLSVGIAHDVAARNLFFAPGCGEATAHRLVPVLNASPSWSIRSACVRVPTTPNLAPYFLRQKSATALASRRIRATPPSPPVAQAPFLHQSQISRERNENARLPRGYVRPDSLYGGDFPLRWSSSWHRVRIGRVTSSCHLSPARSLCFRPRLSARRSASISSTKPLAIATWRAPSLGLRQFDGRCDFNASPTASFEQLLNRNDHLDSRHRAMPIVTIITPPRDLRRQPSGCLPWADPILRSPSDQGTTEALRLGEDNDCTNYAQIDPTHRHGYIDGRLGRRLASDV